MRNRFLASLASFIAVIMPMGGQGERLYAAKEKQAPDEQPYVQVTSVTVDPSTIHKDSKPDRATIFVQIILRGEAPPNATARVDVGTYSSHPADNAVSYPEQRHTIPLKEKLTAVTFTVERSSRTISGKVIIAARIHETTKGVSIKEPECPTDWRAELMTSVP